MYSQYGEDEAILKAVGETGRVLDIGAWHPTDKSNSRGLIERGWEAVLIEPSPGPMVNLIRACFHCGDVPAETWGGRSAVCRCRGEERAIRYGAYTDRIVLIQAAVALENAIIRLSVTDDAVSTSDRDVAKLWAKDGGYYGYVMVPTITIEQITLQFGHFDVVSIDAEGVSVDLAMRYVELGMRPAVMVVEHDNRLAELLQVLNSVGYKAVLTNGTNVVVTR